MAMINIAIFLSTLISILFLFLFLSPTQAQPPELDSKLNRDQKTLSIASNDFGHIIHGDFPLAVLEPTSIDDIVTLINFANQNSCSVATRGQAHSYLGQAMAPRTGYVVNMTNLNGYRNGSGIVVSDSYVDVGGEQLWIDVLHATLEHGLTPLTWTDYLYLTVGGGTLSNAGIGGQTFRFGPQISNVLELDIVTGTGEVMTCSPDTNQEAFHAVLGGLGQFGVITRARIPLGPAPTRVKWLRMIYNDFYAFSRDQEHLISFNERSDANAPDYVEGQLLLNQQPLDLSFYPESDHPRISLLVNLYGITYVIELAKYYDQNSEPHINQDVDNLVKDLTFVPNFRFEKDVTYEEFVNRVHADEEVLESKGLWDVPHPWLNIFIPKSGIFQFNEAVFKGILLEQNLTTGLALVYPMNRNKWDDSMSAVIPDEDIFYTLGLLHAVPQLDQVQYYEAQNKQILKYCENAGIKIKEYLSGGKSHEEWVQHFGSKWDLIQQRKDQFDPKYILSPGQGIFQ